jgi:protein CpxP
MKKKLIIGTMALLCCIGSVMAQGGMQRQTPEERTKATMEKLAPLTLSADQTTKTTAVFSDFYAAQQKAMEDMRASGSMDRDAMMAKRKELSEARDVKLKEIFTADQYKKWTDEVQPSLRPQRKQ